MPARDGRDGNHGPLFAEAGVPGGHAAPRTLARSPAARRGSRLSMLSRMVVIIIRG